MLTTIQINALKPEEKADKVADGKGLYPLVSPSGSPLWRVKFRFHGIEKKMALGRYVSLRQRGAPERGGTAALLDDGSAKDVTATARDYA